jgi:hypothetical protein
MQAIPYYERMMEHLANFNLSPMKEYNGDDITQFEYIKTDMMTQHLRAYKADKLDKIVTLTTDIMDGKIFVYGTTIVPTDEYPLPIFTSEIVPAVNHLSLRVDFIPLADCARDLDYMEKYMMPMEDLWEKHRDIEGSGIERYTWQRVMLSPFYSYGKYKYTIENIEETAMRITIDYLKLYIKLWSGVQKADPGYMKLLNERKRVMLNTMMENDPGEGPLTKGFGKEKAHKILALLF